MLPECPYCARALERPPKRRAKCPHCGEPIVVRTRQTLFPSHLVTEDQALAWDTFAPMRAQFGVTDEDYRRMYDRLTAVFGEPAPPTDVVLSLLDEAGYKGEPSRIPQAYVEQARLVARLGGDPRPRLREAMRLRLELEYRPMRAVGGVRVLASHACCEECEAQQGDEYTIDEALTAMPLPYAGCTRRIYGPFPYCMCTYTTVVRPIDEWLHGDDVTNDSEGPEGATDTDRVSELEQRWAMLVLLIGAIVMAVAVIADALRPG